MRQPCTCHATIPVLPLSLMGSAAWEPVPYSEHENDHLTRLMRQQSRVTRRPKLVSATTT